MFRVHEGFIKLSMQRTSQTPPWKRSATSVTHRRVYLGFDKGSGLST